MSRDVLGPREFARATDGRGPVATGRVREASPVLSEGVERFIFADVFSRSGLGAREREIITVAVLAAIGGADNQLGVHVPAALQCGADPEELIQLCEQIAPYAGFPRALNALRAVRAVMEERGLPLPAPVVEVDLGDAVTLVTDAGAEGADVLLLLHPPELDRRAWRDLVAALPGGWRAVAPDLRGAGAAAAAPVPADAGALVRDALAVLDARGVERATVVAAGGSAPLAAALAEAAPARVAGLVLVGPTRPGRGGAGSGDGTPPPVAFLSRLLTAETLAEDPWGARYARDRLRRCDVEGWAGLVHALSEVDPTATGGRPVRVVVGAEDVVTEERIAAVAWMGATVEHVPGAGHLVALEAPAALAALLTEPFPG